jgi:hypothetical protein
MNRAIPVLLIAALAACADEEPQPPAMGGAESVEVWFSRGEDPVAAERHVRGAPLDGALRALVAGPTPEEQEAGLSSWFSAETAGVLRRVQAADGFVIVDFADLPSLIPNASTSAGSHQLLTALDSTVLQFPWVDSVEYRLEGSCDAFWEWLQRSCDRVRRQER